jgi:hypothetical protein
MKVHASLAFWCTVILFVSGCRSVNTQVELDATHYSVTALILELSENAEKKLRFVGDANLEKIVNRRDTKTQLLPTIHLSPGETREIDEREAYNYAATVYADGSIAENAAVKAGGLIRATLTLLPDGKAVLAVMIEYSEITSWKSYAKIAGREIKYPVVSRKRIETTILPQWGKWHKFGETAATTKAKGQAFLRGSINQAERLPATESTLNSCRSAILRCVYFIMRHF